MAVGTRAVSSHLRSLLKVTDYQVLLPDFNLAGLGWGWVYVLPMRRLPPPSSQDEFDAVSVTQVGSSALGTHPHSPLGSQKVTTRKGSGLSHQVCQVLPHYKAGGWLPDRHVWSLRWKQESHGIHPVLYTSQGRGAGQRSPVVFLTSTTPFNPCSDFMIFPLLACATSSHR